MKAPKRKFLGKSWVGWLNIFILQWLFIRLAYSINLNRQHTKYIILKWIVPTTGWWSDFVYIYKKKEIYDK
jgi:hypothetical protein